MGLILYPSAILAVIEPHITPIEKADLNIGFKISEVSFSIILTCNKTFGTCIPIAKPQIDDTIKKTK